MNRNEIDLPPSLSPLAHGWWNRPGWEECPSCRGSYNLEVEIRCVRCDSPLCPLCAVVLREPAAPAASHLGAVHHACSGCSSEARSSEEASAEEH